MEKDIGKLSWSRYNGGMDQLSPEFAMRGVGGPIPARFLQRERFPEGLYQPDRNTGLPVHTDDMRRLMVSKFSNALQNNRPWMSFISDLDQLKLLNDNHSRLAGDAGILLGASAVTTALATAPFSPELDIYVFALERAGDELAVWAFGGNENDVKIMREVQEQLRNPLELRYEDRTIPIGLSTGLITSTDPALQGRIASVQDWLQKGGSMAYKCYGGVMSETDKMVKQEKLFKEQQGHEKLVVNGNGEGIDSVHKQMVEALGGGRITPHTLKFVLELTHVRALQDLIHKGQDLNSFCTERGVTTEQILDANTPEKVSEVFKKIS